MFRIFTLYLLMSYGFSIGGRRVVTCMLLIHNQSLIH